MKNVSIVFLVLTLCCPVVADDDPNWPCIQVLVPEISAASIWDGPSTDDLKKDKRFSDASRKIVTAVIDNDSPLTEQQLDDYVNEVGKEHQNASLSYLFNEFLKRFNAKRKGQIKNIKRYTKSQHVSAKSIENLIDQIAQLQDQPDQVEQLQQLDSQLFWQKRMFNEREKTFEYLCELPQQVVQQAGQLARMISAKLDVE